MEFWGFNFASDGCVKKSHHHDTAQRAAGNDITICIRLLTLHSLGEWAASQEPGRRNAGKEPAREKKADEMDQNTNIV